MDGKIDIQFIKGTGKETVNGVQCKYASENPTLGVDYVVHPAFTSETQYGGWDTELPGIWVAKFEASSVEENGDIATNNVKIQPGVKSWTNISIGNAYTVSKRYSPSLNSHMLKNSEWGAVAYLAESKYGRNGEEITYPSNRDLYTGGGARDAYITSTSYSSTGNVYGIYDLSAISYEFVAAGYSNQDELETSTGSTKYATVYNGIDETQNYILGDATYETKGLHQDIGEFVNAEDNFFIRSGGADMGYGAGTFCYVTSIGYNGAGSNVISFRIALVV